MNRYPFWFFKYTQGGVETEAIYSTAFDAHNDAQLKSNELNIEIRVCKQVNRNISIEYVVVPKRGTNNE